MAFQSGDFNLSFSIVLKYSWRWSFELHLTGKHSARGILVGRTVSFLSLFVSSPFSLLGEATPLKFVAFILFSFMHQSFETPAPPHSGLSGAFTFYASKYEWSPQFPGTKVNGAFPRPYCLTHGTPFVKQLIIAKRNTLVKRHCCHDEINRLIFQQPANNLQRLLNAQWVCQNIFIVVVSLILLDKLTMKHNGQLSQ